MFDLREKAIEWMDKNPETFELFRRFAFQLHDRGRKFGVNLLRERVRWESHLNSGAELKVPNSFSPYVARRLVRLYPELRESMEFRRTADEMCGEGIQLC